MTGGFLSAPQKDLLRLFHQGSTLILILQRLSFRALVKTCIGATFPWPTGFGLSSLQECKLHVERLLLTGWWRHVQDLVKWQSSLKPITLILGKWIPPSSGLICTFFNCQHITYHPVLLRVCLFPTPGGELQARHHTLLIVTFPVECLANNRCSVKVCFMWHFPNFCHFFQLQDFCHIYL